MGGKRKKSDADGGESSAKDDGEGSKSAKKTKMEVLPSMIKNKEKRSAVHAKLKQQKKLEKRKKAKAREAAEKRALELGEEVSHSLIFLFYLCLFGFYPNVCEL